MGRLGACVVDIQIVRSSANKRRYGEAKVLSHELKHACKLRGRTPTPSAAGFGRVSFESTSGARASGVYRGQTFTNQSQDGAKGLDFV